MRSGRLQSYTKSYCPGCIDIRDISILDIAHSLSMQCRYTGHTKKFYSVAEHSLIVSEYLPPSLKMWGLMHDASEAYLCDFPSPIKKEIPQYQIMEDKIMDVIAVKYQLWPYPMPEEVKQIDNAILNDEKVQAMKYPDSFHWDSIVNPPLGCTINFYPPEVVKALFLERFLELTCA